MWRHYVRYGLSCHDYDTLPPSDLANLQACSNVWDRLSSDWRAVVSIYYSRQDETGQTIHQYCRDHAMPEATAWHIIRSVQRMAAEERGLIERERESRRPPAEHHNKPYRIKPNQNRSDQ